MSFGAFGDGVEFDDFAWLHWGPNSIAPTRRVVIRLVFIAAAKQLAVALQDTQYTFEHAGIKGCEKPACREKIRGARIQNRGFASRLGAFLPRGQGRL